MSKPEPIPAVHSVSDEPFGAFAPRGAAALLIAITRHTFLGRGWVRRRAWPFLAERPQRCYDLKVRGTKMRLHPHDNTVERKLIFRPDRYCGVEIDWLRKHLATGGNYIDIGANVGALTLPLAPLPGVRVIAVEPGPVALPRLRFNVRVNGFDNVIVEGVALSDQEGEVQFVSDESDLKYSGINGRWAQGITVTIPAKTLSGLADEHGFDRIDALKIDVEGHEDAILLPFFEQADKRLWPRHIVIEAIAREGLPDCLTHMRRLGYRDQFQTRANLGMSLADS